MWANAQRDSCPTEYRWCPLFNAAKFGWRPLLECRAVTLPRRETHWNVLGCPKLTNRSQPLAGQSSPYCKDMWGIHCRLTSLFSDCRYVSQLWRYSPRSCTMVPRWRNFGDFFGSCISSELREHISDLHSKFALGPHHMWKYGKHPICDHWD